MTKTAIVALAVAAFLTLLALLPAALNYWLSYLHFGQLYALFFKGREKKHAAGVVYDSGSGFGIPLAKILLFRARDAKLQTVAISDRHGRFALETPPGEEYFLEIRKEGFEPFTSASAKILKSALAYDNNYFGGKFLPRDGHYLFDRAIPLIATKESEKFARAVAFSETVSKILRVMNIPILLFGFIVSILAYLVTKSTFNTVILAIYIIIAIYLIIKMFILGGRSYGYVYNSASSKPVDLALVRAISESSGKLAKTSVSNQRGRFVLALPKGFYKIMVAKAALEQNRPYSIRVKSSFAPRREKIGMKEIKRNDEIRMANDEIKNPNIEIGNSKQILNPKFGRSNQIPTRTFKDAKEIIERYQGGIKEIGKSAVPAGPLKIPPIEPNWKFE